MAKVYEFLANGFEEVEALGPVDIFRRGGVDIKTVSITGDLCVVSSHGVGVMADLLFEDTTLEDATLLMLPGGMPGAENLNAHKGLCEILLSHVARKGMLSAICAAPMVLGRLGLLRGRRATCYPGFEKYLDGAKYTAELCTVDENIITGEGPAATFPYAYTLLNMLLGERKSHVIAEGMMYTHLLKDAR